MFNKKPTPLFALCLLCLASVGCSPGGSTALTDAEKAQVQKGPVDFKSLPEDQKKTIKEKMAAAMSGAPKPGMPPAPSRP